MRGRRCHLVGLSVAALALFAAAPAAALGAVDLGEAVPSLASPAQKPFTPPKPRPTEVRERPTDDPDPNRNAYSVPEAPKSPFCSPHFCVHWVAEGLDAPSLADSDGDGVPDYVQKVLSVAEYVHTVENERLGWREPQGDGRKGGGLDKTDIYLSQIGGDLFGYAAPDRGQISDGHRIPRRLHGYLVLDNDYSPFEFPGTKPIQDLEVTVAHEYNHILQFGYDAYQDPWFAESTATWMEDEVYPGINDYLRYVGRWVHRWDTPLTTASIKEYGSAVWNQWLSRRYGSALIRRAWARAIHVRPGGFSIGVYEAALRSAEARSLGRSFTAFAADVAEWRTGVGFRESSKFPDMPRQGKLNLNRPAQTLLLNHTTFATLQVAAGNAKAVVVKAAGPVGTTSGLALVGRVGTERGGHTVVALDYSAGGGKLSVRLDRPGRFSRISAVVVNADARASGYNARRLDWRYLTDRVPFSVRGELVR